MAWCASLPWIGKITKFHLAKNFGVRRRQPDVHLQRLAEQGVTPHELCADLAVKTGYRIATIDLLLWRACANRVLNSRSAELEPRPRDPQQPATQGELF